MRLSAIVLILLLALGCATSGVSKSELATSHHRLGDQLLREEDFVGAMRELLKAAELDSRNPEIQMSLAVAYRNRGLPEDALQSLRRAVELDPENPETRQALGALLLQLYRYDEAIEQLRIAAKDLRYRTPHFAYTNLGLAYLGKNEPLRAIESFRQALETASNFVFAHRGLGDAYYLLGRFDEAAESYRTALSYHASDGDSQLGLGLCQAKLGRPEEARKAFQAAMDIAPASEAARRARLYLDRLDRGAALEP